jgi:hypothetical protein
MRDLGDGASPDELPEWSEASIAELIRTRGWGAFSVCTCADELAVEQTLEGAELDCALLRFPCGVLKLVRGCYANETPKRFIVSVDFHDYRSAVLDPRIVEDAYRRFAYLAERFALGLRLGGAIEIGCCPAQGSVYVAMETAGTPLLDTALRVFLASYFAEERVVSDLHRAFGEAAVGFAKATVPEALGALTM